MRKCGNNFGAEMSQKSNKYDNYGGYCIENMRVLELCEEGLVVSVVY